jgi:hypothetical protein
MPTSPQCNVALSLILTPLLSLFALAEEPADEEKADGPEPVLTIGRYLGYRAATDVTPESDYNFTLFDDGSWSYKPLLEEKAETGELGDGLAAWKKKLAKTGLDKLEPPKGPLLAVEDAPAFTIESTEGGKKRTIKLAPDHKTAAALHELIQELRKPK